MTEAMDLNRSALQSSTAEINPRPPLPPSPLPSPIYSTPHNPPSQPRVSLATSTPPTAPQPLVSIETSPPAPSHLPLRVEHLEVLCVRLQKEKRELEEGWRVVQDGFGRQRKAFMDQMMRTESELSLTKQSADRYANEVRELSTQLLLRDEELRVLRERARTREEMAREAFDTDRVRYEETIQELQQAVEGKSHAQNN